MSKLNKVPVSLGIKFEHRVQYRSNLNLIIRLGNTVAREPNDHNPLLPTYGTSHCRLNCFDHQRIYKRI